MTERSKEVPLESPTIRESWLMNTELEEPKHIECPLWLLIIKELIIDDTFAEDVKQLDSLLHM